jgi:hypothetical protein
MLVCWNCDELGHYRSSCPHLRREVGYTPLCGRCRQQGHIANECSAPNPAHPSSERDWNKAKQVQFQEEKDAAKSVNHIAKDTSYFVTRSGKKTQDVREGETSNSEIEVPVEIPKTPKENPPVSILASIFNNEIPPTQTLDNIPLPVEEIQPRINPTVVPTLPTRIVNPTMKSTNRTIPGKGNQLVQCV